MDTMTSDPASVSAAIFRVGQSIDELRVIPDLPIGRRVSVDAAEDLSPLPGGRDESSAVTVFIDYRDAKGEASQRRITCQKISGHKRVEHIHAYCHERRQPRMFDIARIVEMIDASTGEVLDPRRHCEVLRQRGLLPTEDKSLTAMMRLLKFMAKCDGAIHRLERIAIEEAVARYCVRFGGDDRLHDSACASIKRLAPDGGDVTRSLTAIARAPDALLLSNLIIESTANVIDADGQNHDQEVRWSVEIGRTLKMIAVGASI